MMSRMAEYQRTQVYLPPDQHRRLRQLAADRGVSMATVVREAVGEYLAGPPEPARTGLVERLRALLAESPAASPEAPALGEEDRALGEALWQEQERHLGRRTARQDAGHRS